MGFINSERYALLVNDFSSHTHKNSARTAKMTEKQALMQFKPVPIYYDALLIKIKQN